MNPKYRHELKYVVSVPQIACLRSRILSIMKLDKHTGENGSYNIRSVYFDDYKDTCFFDNEEGTSPRGKFRIRIYNGSDETIHLERKRKVQGKTQKDACMLTKEQCFQVLNDGILPVFDEYPEVLKHFCLLQRNVLLKPKIIVEYEREPYVYQNGNVRITFDTDIRSMNEKGDFFKEKTHARPIMPVGVHLMEVKYDEYLPDYIYKSLQIDNLQLSAFSKYYLCRKYSMGGIR